MSAVTPNYRFLTAAGFVMALGLAVAATDGFANALIRGYGGDAIATCCLVLLLAGLGTPARTAAVTVFLVACAVEFSQTVRFQRLGAELITGTTFDPVDFILYAVGIALAVAIMAALKEKPPPFPET